MADKTTDGLAAYDHLLQSARLYHFFSGAVLTFCTPLLALLMFLIAKKSPNGMQLSKWILINCTITSYLIVALIVFWQPVPTPAPYANFCIGPLRQLDEHASNLAYKLLVMLVLNLCICYSLEFAYQCAYVGRIAVPARAHFRYRQRIYATVITTYLTIMCVIGLFIILGMDIFESGSAQFEYEHEAGSLQYVLREREQTLISFVVRDWSGALFVTGLLALTTILGVGIVSLNVKFIHMLTAMKATLYADTFSLQLAIYQFFLTKTLIVLFLVIMPIIGDIFALVTGLETLRIQFAAYYILPLHMPLLYLHTIFFFKPYQRFMLYKLGIRSNSSNGSVAAAPPTIIEVPKC